MDARSRTRSVASIRGMYFMQFNFVASTNERAIQIRRPKGFEGVGRQAQIRRLKVVGRGGWSPADADQQMLTDGAMQHGRLFPRTQGTPQGGVFLPC